MCVLPKIELPRISGGRICREPELQFLSRRNDEVGATAVTCDRETRRLRNRHVSAYREEKLGNRRGPFEPPHSDGTRPAVTSRFHAAYGPKVAGQVGIDGIGIWHVKMPVILHIRPPRIPHRE